MTLAGFEAVQPAHVPSLVMKQDRPLTKHAIKSKATRDALLKAAEQIFARDGYERAQIDEIAQLSGRTRGAVYAQYKTKEQLFFAVQEQQIESAKAELQTLLSKIHAEDYAGKLAALREYYSNLREPRSGILDLELKLYALRHPESAAAWAERYTKIFAPGRFAEDFRLTQLPGHSKLSSRILALPAVKTALILAMEFLPDHLPKSEAKLLLKEIFDGLFPPESVRGSAPKKKARAVRKKAVGV